MNTLFGIIAGIGTLIGSLFGIHHSNPVAGSYNPTGGGTYRLQSSIGTSDASITLTSFKEPVSNIPYTMTYLNTSIEYATIDPQTNTKEFISFSGITQNGDGSATLTGVIRGLSFSYPYTASSTFQQAHSAQGILILSNPPQLTNQYGNLNNANTWLGINTFTSGQNPTYTAVPASYNATDLVAYQTLLNTAISGAATSSETNMGIVQLATQTQLNANTASSSEGRPLVIPNKLATSTCQQAKGATLISSSTTGKLGGNCLDQTYAYSFSGLETFTGTTSISASNVNTNPLKLNGVAYKFPSAQGASSTVLANDGSGNLSSVPFDWQLLSSTTTTAAMGIATTTVTGTPQDLLLVILNPSAITGGTTNYNLCFNGDAGTNYGFSYLAFGGGESSVSQSSQNCAILAGVTATTSPGYFSVNIKNTVTNIKRFTWNGTLSSSGAISPAVYSGGGSWNNTSNAISTIQLRAGSGASQTFPSGMTIQLYGSRN